MSDRLVHLVRHGEVHNPAGVVYGRLEGFGLSDRGHRLAEASARHLESTGREISVLRTSPLQRAQESAAPVATLTGLTPELRPELLEATSRLEGKDYDVSLAILRRPEAWRFLVNPLRPSWGEPYAQVRDRMLREVKDAFDHPSAGDAVLVSHQMPIWMMARTAARRSLAHDPRRRRCALSSITSLALREGQLVEVAYFAPEVP